MTRSTLKLRLVQMTSTDNHDGNIAMMRGRAKEAASEDCDLLAMPEVAGLMNRDSQSLNEAVRDDEEDPFVIACCEEAAKHGLWIHTGSTPVRAPDGRFLNRTHLIDNAGRIVAIYDKIHLFDVHLEGREPLLESKRYAPGTEAVVVDTPWGLWGLSICYDLRFPNLYRTYAKAGATVMFIPSAFTRPTGEAHWEPLIRARAIENGAFVIAAAQTGEHDDGRKTWGQSLVVDPWGGVLADLGHTANAKTVSLDLETVHQARKQIPSLENEKLFNIRRIESARTMLTGETA